MGIERSSDGARTRLLRDPSCYFVDSLFHEFRKHDPRRYTKNHENALGLVYQGKLDTWRAERAFKRASELDSKWAAPHYNLALLYRSQQNQAALAEFEAAASSDQSNVNLLAALGDEFFTRQLWKPAAEAFRKAVALKPSDDNLHTKLGHALYSQGLQDEANREYQRAQELRRKQP